MTDPVEQGATEDRGDMRVLHFLVRLPRPMEEVWPVVAGHGERLGEWLAAAEVFEPRLGGAVVLRRAGAGAWPEADTWPEGEAVAGRITAWDVERVAEYTLEGRHGRLRFHLEPGGEHGTTLRFTHEYEGGREPSWHQSFERLLEALDADRRP